MKSAATLSGSHRGRPGAPARLWPCATLALLLAGCGDDHVRKYPQTTFHPTTEFARVSDALFWLTAVLNGGALVWLFSPMGAAVLRSIRIRLYD